MGSMHPTWKCQSNVHHIIIKFLPSMACILSLRKSARHRHQHHWEKVKHDAWTICDLVGLLQMLLMPLSIRYNPLIQNATDETYGNFQIFLILSFHCCVPLYQHVTHSLMNWKTGSMSPVIADTFATATYSGTQTIRHWHTQFEDRKHELNSHHDMMDRRTAWACPWSVLRSCLQALGQHAAQWSSTCILPYV